MANDGEGSGEQNGPLLRRALKGATKQAGKIRNSHIAAAASALVLAITAGAGGLNATPVETVGVLALGETHTNAQLDWNFTEVRSIPVLPGTPDPGCGLDLVVVIADVTVTDNHPTSVFTQDLQLLIDAPAEATTAAEATGTAARGQEPVSVTADRVFLGADATLSPTLQPLMTERVFFIWDVPEGLFDVGTEVRLGIYDRSDSTGPQPQWTNPVPGAQLDATTTPMDPPQSEPQNAECEQPADG